MENHLSAKQWFLQRATGELFVIASVGWLLLFFLELIKPGLVSNYFSLPHASLFLGLLGIWHLSVFKPQPQSRQQLSAGRLRTILIVLSILLALTLPLITDLSLPLTLFLIFVTVASLWAGTAMMTDEQ